MPKLALTHLRKLSGSLLAVFSATLLFGCTTTESTESSSASDHPRKQIEHHDPMGGPSTFTYQ